MLVDLYFGMKTSRARDDLDNALEAFLADHEMLRTSTDSSLSGTLCHRRDRAIEIIGPALHELHGAIVGLRKNAYAEIALLK